MARKQVLLTLITASLVSGLSSVGYAAEPPQGIVSSAVIVVVGAILVGLIALGFVMSSLTSRRNKQEIQELMDEMTDTDKQKDQD